MYPGYGRHCLSFHVLDVGQSCRVTPRAGNIQQKAWHRNSKSEPERQLSQEVGTSTPKTQIGQAGHRSFLIGENEKGHPHTGQPGLPSACDLFLTWWVRPEQAQTITPRHRPYPGAGQASLCKPQLPLPTSRQSLIFKVQGSLSEN